MWPMSFMVRIPSTYIFHYPEERPTNVHPDFHEQKAYIIYHLDIA